MKVRYSYQLLATGFSASAEIVEASMVYTHTHIDYPAPINGVQIEVEFIDELANVKHWRVSHHPYGT